MPIASGAPYEAAPDRGGERVVEGDPGEQRDGYLYRDAWLAVASKWAEGKQLGPIERAFLSASQEAERQRREKEIGDAKRLAEAEAERARQAEQLAEQAVVRAGGCSAGPRRSSVD